MDKETIKKIILKYNTLVPENIFKRDLEISEIKLNKAITIIGPRRAGKSYYLYSLFKKEEKPVFINFEDNQLQGIKNNELELIKECAKELFGPEKLTYFFDEIQDMLWDCVFVVNEALSGSPYKMRIYAGTPKTLENTLESLWQRSSKKEWIIKCKHCGKYNIPCDPYVYKMITKEGFVCANCKKFLDVSNGTWHSFNRNMVGEFEGFHIPQVIVPRNVEYNMFDPADRPNNGPPKAWKEIWNKYEIESPQHFANEVLGISHSTGGRLISRLELEQSITLPPMHVIAANFKKTAYKFITAGVDWGIQDDRSRTVLTIVGVKTNGYIDVLHVKKYLGIDILDQISSIITLCIKWKVDVVGCDFGVGYTNNRLVRQQLGYDKIMEFQYCSMRTSSLLVWNPKAARYMLNRTEAINILFIDLKREYIKFPKDITPYFDDILAVYEEILESGNKVFRHSRNDPDDFLHSLNYANIAAKKLSGIVLVS